MVKTKPHPVSRLVSALKVRRKERIILSLKFTQDAVATHALVVHLVCFITYKRQLIRDARQIFRNFRDGCEVVFRPKS